MHKIPDLCIKSEVFSLSGFCVFGKGHAGLLFEQGREKRRCCQSPDKGGLQRFWPARCVLIPTKRIKGETKMESIFSLKGKKLVLADGWIGR